MNRVDVVHEVDEFIFAVTFLNDFLHPVTVLLCRGIKYVQGIIQAVKIELNLSEYLKTLLSSAVSSFFFIK